MISEFELIAKLAKTLPRPSSRVLLGIGDDAAVVRLKNSKSLLTVDSLVEGIHFDFAFCKPEEVGHKALAVNLSDIAAMGGKPLAAVVSLGVSSIVGLETLEKVYKGISQLAKNVSIDVVGGNITSSPERLFISITVVGESAGKILTRSGAQSGDVIFVTGELGEAAAGLSLLKKQGRKAVTQYRKLTDKYLKPRPRLECGEIFAGRPAVHSLIDISDGLSSELWHLAKASSAKLTINEERLPYGKQLEAAAKKFKINRLDWLLSGGEDYELLGTCSRKDWPKIQQKIGKKGISIHQIGTVSAGKPSVYLREISGAEIPIRSTGWNHLRTAERD